MEYPARGRAPEAHADGFAAWTDWAERNEGASVDSGGPLGRRKRLSASGVADICNDPAASTVVRAESHEAAAKLLEGYPHFTVFPGDGVEVVACLSIPSA